MEVKTGEKKLRVSITNWILGGPLIAVEGPSPSPSPASASASTSARKKKKKMTMGQSEVEVVNDNINISTTTKSTPPTAKSTVTSTEPAKITVTVNGEGASSCSKKTLKNEVTDSSKNIQAPDSKRPTDANNDDDAKKKDFTKEQDAQIKNLRSENQTWTQIAVALGKNKSEIKERWKVLFKNVENDKGKDKKENDNKTKQADVKDENKNDKNAGKVTATTEATTSAWNEWNSTIAAEWEEREAANRARSSGWPQPKTTTAATNSWGAKANEDKNKAATGGTGDRKWTREEDIKIVYLLNEENTWMEIATELNSTIEAVQRRFLELKERYADDKIDGTAGESAWEAAAAAGRYSWNAKGGENTTATAAAAGDPWNTGGNNSWDAPTGAKGKAAAAANAWDTGNSSWNTTSKKTTAEEDDPFFAELDFSGSTVKFMEPEKHADVKTKIDAKTKGTSSYSAFNSSNQNNTSSSSSAPPKSGIDPANIATRAYGRLQPDSLWSIRDVEILDSLEARFMEHKWLHVQAAFYNFTGRMVPAPVIERKFRDDGAL